MSHDDGHPHEEINFCNEKPTVRYVDFQNRANNSFLAISQFKVKIPGTEHHIVPDIVLFLNGLPIGVIECKAGVRRGTSSFGSSQ